MKLRFALLSVILLTAGLMSAQVEVTVTPSRSEYLVGEPVFVTVQVKNVGFAPDMLGYSQCDGKVTLTVEGLRKEQPQNLLTCAYGVGVGAGSACGIDHIPTLSPGESASFTYLLKDYRLAAGEHILRASGKAPVRWTALSYLPNGALSAPRRYKPGEPVPGEMFDVSFKLIVRDGTEDQLRQRLAPLVAAADGSDLNLRWQAREAISEVAPAFLEAAIARYASEPNTRDMAIRGLGRIRTPESRSDLMRLLLRSPDPSVRAEMMKMLAGMPTGPEIQFFAAALVELSTPEDDHVREYAALGLGHVGGDSAVNGLVPGMRDTSREVRTAVAIALGNTRSRLAPPTLMEMYADPDGLVRNEVCGAFITLTHYRWCNGGGTVPSEQARWREWWRVHGETTPLYGLDSCPEVFLNVPELR